MNDVEVVTRRINKTDLQVLNVTVRDELFEKACWLEEGSSVHDKIDPTEWTGGFIENAVTVGTLGEFAYQIAFPGLQVDAEYKKKGTPHDFLIGDIRLEVKTQTELYSHEQAWIRATGERGGILYLKADLYGFGYLETFIPSQRLATIILVGYFTREELAKRTPVPSRSKRATHMNREFPYSRLTPLVDLWRDYIEHLGKQNG